MIFLVDTNECTTLIMLIEKPLVCRAYINSNQVWLANDSQQYYIYTRKLTESATLFTP